MSRSTSAKTALNSGTSLKSCTPATTRKRTASSRNFKMKYTGLLASESTRAQLAFRHRRGWQHYSLTM
jgi:hypothetical protein